MNNLQQGGPAEPHSSIALNNRGKFLTIRQKYNTTSYRGENTHKKNPTELLGKQHYKFVNESKFVIVKTLSRPGDTGSGSYVILVKSKEDGYQYVLKVTGLFKRHVENNPYRPKHNFPELESAMYGVINRLVKNNITPHVFMKVDELPNIEREKLLSRLANGKVRSYFKRYGIPSDDGYNSYTHCYAMLNETASEGVEITTLRRFLVGESSIKFDGTNIVIEMRKKILTNILFQILYTLEVFNRVGIIHNDLHFYNIFILIRPINILTPGYEKMNKTYTFEAEGVEHKVVLESIGIDVRIYDFDRSYKFPKPGTKYEDTMFCEKMYGFEDINECHHNTSTLELKEQNTYFDTYKVLEHFFSEYFDLTRGEVQKLQTRYKNFIKVPGDFITLIKSFFIEESLLKGNKRNNLMKGVVIDKGKPIDFLTSIRYNEYMREYNRTYNDRYKQKAEDLRYFNFLNDLPVGYMKTTEEMLVQMATDTDIKKLLSDPEEPSEFGAVENFDMKYINVDMVNNVKRTMAKKFAEKTMAKKFAEKKMAKTEKKFAEKSMALPKTTRRRSTGNASKTLRNSPIRKGSVRSAPAKLKSRAKNVWTPPKNVRKPKSLRVRSLPTKTQIHQTKKKPTSLPAKLKSRPRTVRTPPNNNSSGSKYINYITIPIPKEKNNAEA
jgi:hypothetical protein